MENKEIDPSDIGKYPELIKSECTESFNSFENVITLIDQKKNA
jgi:hypothetical protein